MEIAGYSWYGDDELLALIDRFVARASDKGAAARQLKIWLARNSGEGQPPAAPEAKPAIHAKRTSEPAIAARQKLIDSRAWLTRKEAAAYIGVSPKTMANWANDPEGPPFRRRGGVRYPKEELDRWLERQTR